MKAAVVGAAVALCCTSGGAFAAGACLTDGEIDRALGDQVRSGALFVDVRAVPDLPLCSGLTLAQQIQRIRSATFPEEQREDEAKRAALVAREEDAARSRQTVVQAASPEPVELAEEAERPSLSANRPVRKPRAKVAPARRVQAHFASCREARAAGAAPLRRGDPGYTSRLDRDGDGVACE